MIRTLLLGAARVLFNAAVLALALTAVLGYASYRLARSAVKNDRGQPAREAAFASLLSLVALARALKLERLSGD